MTVTDDDGGMASNGLVKVITDDRGCTSSQGFWNQQFDPEKIGKGASKFTEDELLSLLLIVNFGSGILNPVTLENANNIFDPPKLNNGENATDSGSGSNSTDLSGFEEKALAQTLAAWLNFAKGSIGWGELIDFDGDSVGDMTFGELIFEVETLLTNPDATKDELERAKDLAEAVNLLDKDNPDCDTG